MEEVFKKDLTFGWSLGLVFIDHFIMMEFYVLSCFKNSCFYFTVVALL